MDDTTFLQAFETRHLAPFRHVDHLRVAWLYLRAYSTNEAIIRVRYGIQHFVVVHGASSKYHETITLFWVKAVNAAIQQMPTTENFDDFLQANPHLLEKGFMQRHYSPERLSAGRHIWLEPDLQPLVMT